MPAKLKSLNRLLSQRGYCSRKVAESLIRDGKVKVNDRIIRDPFHPVPTNAAIELAGSSPPEKIAFLYVVMNKRRGVVTTARDELNRKTVYDDLKLFLERENISERLFAVGRLDKDTDGLLLFTNDNRFADFLLNPDNRIPKTYRATLVAPISEDALQAIQNGVAIEARGLSYLALARDVQRLSAREVELTLAEGKNREVRRLFEAVGNKVTRLTRARFANLRLDALHLNKGESALIDKEDIWNEDISTHH